MIQKRSRIYSNPLERAAYPSFGQIPQNKHQAFDEEKTFGRETSVLSCFLSPQGPLLSYWRWLFAFWQKTTLHVISAYYNQIWVGGINGQQTSTEKWFFSFATLNWYFSTSKFWKFKKKCNFSKTVNAIIISLQYKIIIYRIRHAWNESLFEDKITTCWS